MAGKFTPYAAYSNRPFQEVQGGAVASYKEPGYDCPHSQRAPQYMFDTMEQKQVYDAANTSCCEEQVRPLANKPGYIGTGSPMQGTDCANKQAGIACGPFEVNTMGAEILCALGTPQINMIKLQCPGNCLELQTLGLTGRYMGLYGEFLFLGSDSPKDWVAAYRPNSATVQEVYDHCSGSVTYNDPLCGKTLPFVLRASLADPTGCYCDCCGVGGHFTPPTHLWDKGTPSAVLTNDITLPYVKLDTACYGGGMAIAWGGTYFTWTSGPTYISDGTTHYIGGQPAAFTPYVGGAVWPACCGFSTITYYGDDGCSWTGNTSINIPAYDSTPTLTPSYDTIITAGTGTVTLSLQYGCPYSQLKEWDNSSSTCITVPDATFNTSTGEFSITMTPPTLTNSIACRQCCGSGEIYSVINNGCNIGWEANWSVRWPLKTGASSYRVGTTMRCRNDGADWHLEWTYLYCNGSSWTSWSNIAAYATFDQCAGENMGMYLSEVDLVGHPGYLASCATCHVVGYNGESGANLRGYAWCVHSDDLSNANCCSRPEFVGGYVGYHGSEYAHCCMD